MKKNVNSKKLWKYFFMSLFIGFGVTLPLELSLAFVAKYFFDVTISIPNLLWIAFVSIVIGGFIMGMISKRLITPLTNLSSALNRVAQGDFKTEIKTESKMKVVQDIYTDFNTMVSELNATETLQTDFVSGVSHEIKTPITAIEGYATLLQQSTEDEIQAEYVDKILFNTRRLSELAGNILLLSKVDNKAIQTNRKTYRLDEQIRQSIVFLEPHWCDKDIDFDVEMDEIIYNGDESLMFHVWNNLIDNAVKFNPVGGFIKIRLYIENDNIIFSIEDGGCGIKDEEKLRIFNKFYQCDSSHRIEGNGLGLALVKNILDLCNGKISVDDGEKNGARFTVTL